MRIDKVLAHCGYGSRKDVRRLIRGRHVQVDGKVVEKPGTHVNPEKQTITLYGEEVNYEQFTYLMLNKPQGYISATFDHSHLTIIDLVPDQYTHLSLFPIGRLDKDTEGLILLTNDGEINHILTSPKSNIWKTYEVQVDGQLTEQQKKQLQEGVTLDDGYVTKKAYLTILRNEQEQSLAHLSITEGKFHQVKRMFKAVGREVLYLKRLKIGEIELDSDLALGDIRTLRDREKEWLLSLKRGD